MSRSRGCGSHWGALSTLRKSPAGDSVPLKPFPGGSQGAMILAFLGGGREVLENVFTPLYPFWKTVWNRLCHGRHRNSPSRTLGGSSPASQPALAHTHTLTPSVLAKQGVGAGGFLELQTHPPNLSPKAALGGPFLILLKPLISHRGPLKGRRQKEGNGQGSPPPPRVPQSLAQRPWLPASKYGGREEWLPSHCVTFSGPQRRAPGPSLPRTAPLVPPGLRGSRKFLFPFLVGLESS